MPLRKIAIGTGMVVAAVVVVPIVLASVTFETMFPSNGELAQKTEWSVLQGLALAHNDARQAAPALIVRHALNSEYTAIGFPARGKAKGYVWLLANPTTKPCVKQLPFDEDFVMTAAVLDWVESQTALDPRLKAYLESPTRHVLAAGFERVPAWDLEGCRK